MHMRFRVFACMHTLLLAFSAPPPRKKRHLSDRYGGQNSRKSWTPAATEAQGAPGGGSLLGLKTSWMICLCLYACTSRRQTYAKCTKTIVCPSPRISRSFPCTHAHTRIHLRHLGALTTSKATDFVCMHMHAYILHECTQLVIIATYSTATTTPNGGHVWVLYICTQIHTSTHCIHA